MRCLLRERFTQNPGFFFQFCWDSKALRKQKKLYPEYFPLLLQHSLTLVFRNSYLNRHRDMFSFTSIAFTTLCNCDKKCIYQPFLRRGKMTFQTNLWPIIISFWRILSLEQQLFRVLVMCNLDTQIPNLAWLRPCGKGALLCKNAYFRKPFIFVLIIKISSVSSGNTITT